VWLLSSVFDRHFFLQLFPSAETPGMSWPRTVPFPVKTISVNVPSMPMLFSQDDAAGVQAYRVSFDWSISFQPSARPAPMPWRFRITGRFYGVENMTGSLSGSRATNSRMGHLYRCMDIPLRQEHVAPGRFLDSLRLRCQQLTKLSKIEC